MSHMNPILTQGDGYGIIVVFGALFALGMVAATYILKRYHGKATDSSENFSTVNRTVKTGLIASAIVSAWIWAATLLQSSSIAYSYGIYGPFWYASGATVQIVLFCIIAIELKRRAPLAHTFLEVIHARYGQMVHLVSIVFCICTNILVTAMLLTGGTIVYTMFGRIKATFLTDYVHTVAVLIIILFFTFVTFTTSPLLGSTSKVYDLLVNASWSHPIEGNTDGFYLTMRSSEGAIFFIINITGNFASPVSALPGYILGGLSWFAVPFLCATTMGLAAAALESNLKASGKKLIYISHVSVVTFGLIMSAVASGLYYINIDLGYLYLFMGVIISSAVVPGALTLLWNRQSKWAACLSPVFGVICSITAWLIVTKVKFGTLTVHTTGSNTFMLVGNIVALCSSVLFVSILSFIAPDKEVYNFNSMKEIKRDDEEPQNLPIVSSDDLARELALLTCHSKVARITAALLRLCLIILWP
ncbi:unnamed protein product [Adineta ricciae]|uniref:Uncharacterized protein n=1 Tax=Adineta ricciae TaxID=249248 RepID=A0A814PHU7_ADIRI|nr:unnamed protein product [Adineta ricciae]CAF1106975.1 unnamed protein product [Adineta ricciae]